MSAPRPSIATALLACVVAARAERQCAAHLLRCSNAATARAVQDGTSDRCRYLVSLSARAPAVPSLLEHAHTHIGRAPLVRSRYPAQPLRVMARGLGAFRAS